MVYMIGLYADSSLLKGSGNDITDQMETMTSSNVDRNVLQRFAFKIGHGGIICGIADRK